MCPPFWIENYRVFACETTNFTLGLYECGAGLPHSNPQGNVGPNQAVFGLAIFKGGAAQFAAGIMEFGVGNTFGNTVHCSYAAFWLSYAMFLIPSLDIEGQYGGNQRAYTFAMGIYLIMWCFLTVLFVIAALKINLVIIMLFFVLVFAFSSWPLPILLPRNIPRRVFESTWPGGALTGICAAVAFYAGASGLMVPETTWVRFPLGEIPVRSACVTSGEWN